MAKRTIILDDYEKSTKKKAKLGRGISSKMVKIIVAVVVVVAIAVTGIVVFLNDKNSYIADVNGKRISVTDFEAELSSVVSSYLSTAADEQDLDTNDAVEVEKFWNSTNEDGVNMRLAAKQEAMQNLVKYTVQLLKAEEEGIVLTQYDKANLIREAEAQAEYYYNYYSSYGYTSAKKVEDFVEEQYGCSYSEYKRLYTENYIINQLMVMKQAQMDVTDGDITAWYEKDPDAYNLYVVNTIYVSYQEKDDDNATVMLEGAALKAKQDLVTEIEDLLNTEESTFAEIAEDKDEGTTHVYSLSKKDGEVSLTNASANMEEVNAWLNETGLKDASAWTKIEVKGVSTGSFKDDIVGVYFVKFDSVVDINTPDNESATSMRSGIKAEILSDRYNQLVEEWAADTAKYVVNYNGDSYKNFTVAGFKAE